MHTLRKIHALLAFLALGMIVAIAVVWGASPRVQNLEIVTPALVVVPFHVHAVLIVVFVWAFLCHLMVVWHPDLAETRIQSNMNVHRWAKFCITVALLTLAVAQLVTITHIMFLVCIFFVILSAGVIALFGETVVYHRYQSSEDESVPHQNGRMHTCLVIVLVIAAWVAIFWAYAEAGAIPGSQSLVRAALFVLFAETILVIVASIVAKFHRGMVKKTLSVIEWCVIVICFAGEVAVASCILAYIHQ